MFHLTLKCDNEAFSDGMLPHEVSRILRKLASDVENNLGIYSDGSLIDANGNKVGKWSYETI